MVRFLQSIGAFILTLTLVSCQEVTPESTGTLRLMATDAPFNFENVSRALITVEEIRMKNFSSGEKVTVMSLPVTLDLMTLRNGIVETLSDIEIPVGKYSEIIFLIKNAKIEMKDGRHFPFKIPSGESSGLKIKVNPDIEITARSNTDVLLDFDLSRSFVATMNGHEVSSFNFKPVIRAMALAMAGTVSGQVLDVTDETPIAGAIVTVKNGSEVITTAVTDTEGFFKILGLPAQTYNITAEAIQYGNLTIGSVPVTAGHEVTTHFILTPVTPVL